MPYLKLEVGPLLTNMYVLYSESNRDGLIIDPGADAEKIIRLVENEKIRPQAVILTHGHADHLGAAASVLSHFRVPLSIHEADEDSVRSQFNREIAAMFAMALPPPADRLLRGGDTIGVGDLATKVIHSPGHTPGSILLHCGNLLFTGDTLFQGDIGRTDLPGGDDAQMRSSLDQFRFFPRKTIILPGHGPSSILEQELATNPYL